MSVKSRPPLFYYQPLAEDSTRLTIEGEEAIHALKARRLRPNDPVQLTNGGGLLGIGQIETVTAKPPSLEVRVESVEITPAPKFHMILASALPKGERLATLLDMATQLGMAEFIPLQCDHSVVNFQPKMIQRWQRVILSAAKQCRQSWMPQIGTPRSPRELLAQAGSDSQVFYGDPAGSSIYQQRTGIIESVRSIVVMIGPEGGFSANELSILQNHPQASALGCGSLVLRTETAGLALLAAVGSFLHSPNK